jgi:zinc protease
MANESCKDIFDSVERVVVLLNETQHFLKGNAVKTTNLFARRVMNPLKRTTGIATALFLSFFIAQPLVGQRHQSSNTDSIKIPFESYHLSNGLNVILSVEHSVPTVAVDIWYHVGSKNEVPGRAGFAHLFEHVMFTGSGHVPYGLQDKLTEGVGGSNNAFTYNDRTNYFDLVPSNYLESALWLEADKMGFLLDTLDLAKLNAQRDIVKNERRQNYENRPYGRVSEIFSAAVYPKGHPYSWPVIGSMEDLSAASEEDVKDFFRLYYAPNNATVAVVGDFDPAQAKAWIAKYFGDLPQGEAVQRPPVSAVLATDTASTATIARPRAARPSAGAPSALPGMPASRTCISKLPPRRG